MMYEVGDKITFTPSAYLDGSNGSEASKINKERAKVHGAVTEVNLEHRWYRVAWKPEYDREQHECFKF